MKMTDLLILLVFLVVCFVRYIKSREAELVRKEQKTRQRIAYLRSLIDENKERLANPKRLYLLSGCTKKSIEREIEDYEFELLMLEAEVL